MQLVEFLKKYRNLAISLFIVALGFLTYSNSFQNEFVWDDEFLIQNNRFIRSFKYLPESLTTSSTAGAGKSDSFFRPTQQVFYTIIYQLSELNPVGYHIGNALLHSINGVLLFLFTLALFKSFWGSLLTASLWVAHPAHTEAITYISGTADPMSTLFALSLLLLFTKNIGSLSWKLQLVLCALMTLAVFSKESMVVVPPLTMVILFCSYPESRWKPKLYMKTLPIWTVVGVFLILRSTVLNFENTYSFYNTSNIYTENIHYRIFTYLATLPDYLRVLFFPIDLRMERNFPVHVGFTTPVLLGIAFVVFCALGSFLQRKLTKPQPFLTGTLWFFAAFVPMMGIIIPVNSFFLEHWLYFTSIGLFWAFSMTILKIKFFSEYPRTVLVLLLLLLIPSVVLAHKRNLDWKNPKTFYLKILEHNPKGTARVHNNLAMAYAEDREYGKAKEHYISALRLSDKHPETHYNLSRLYVREGDFPSAKTHLYRALELWPGFPHAQNLLRKIDQHEKSGKPVNLEK